MTRGDIIKSYMAKYGDKGIEVKDLAPIVGVSPGYFYKVLGNKSIPNKEILRKIAEVLNFDVAEIIPDENETVDRIALDTPEILNRIDDAEYKNFFENPINDAWIGLLKHMTPAEVEHMLKTYSEENIKAILFGFNLAYGKGNKN